MQTDYKSNLKRMIIIISALSVLLIILFFVSLCVGRYAIPAKDVFGLIFGQKVPDMSQRVVIYLRLPRTLCAVLVGIALSVSGAVYQSAFNNKLVSPDLLGVSSGASVGACFAILLGMSTILISLF